MNKYLTLTAALMASSSAFAGAPAYVAPAAAPIAAVAPVVAIAAPVSDWSGLYVGAQAGVLNGDLTGLGIEAALDGAIYGGHVGYNYDFGSFVLGAEIDYNIGSGEGVIPGDPPVDLDYTLSHLKARAGYDLGSALIYGTGGLAWFEYSNSGAGTDGTGYFVGLGAEYRITNDWTVGAEYLYHQFDDFIFDGSGVDLTLSTIQARVSYHF